MAAPLTDLFKRRKKNSKIQLNTDAHKTFALLKNKFVNAPILKLPNPNQPFIVEVDASEVWRGVVLSQRQGNPEKLHPCAFLWKLTPADRSYDISNRKLLTIKTALKKWRLLV